MDALSSVATAMSLGTGPRRVACKRRHAWTAQADAHLVRMRQDGHSLRAMASALGLSRSIVVDRASELGLHVVNKLAKLPVRHAQPAPDPSESGRNAMPAGHPISWDLINEGTCLAGSLYTAPSNARLSRAGRGEV